MKKIFDFFTLKNHCKKKGFTLAEILMVLITLGIIASVTIPALVRKQIEASNRTKIKRAMSIYDYVMNKIIVENGIKSINSLYSDDENSKMAFAPKNNCQNTSAYFKKEIILNNNQCTFCSADAVCWDISNILNPKISLNKDDLVNDTDMKKTFSFYSWFYNNGNLRVDDILAADKDTKEQLLRLYNYVNNVKSTEEESIPENFGLRSFFTGLGYDLSSYTDANCATDEKGRLDSCSKTFKGKTTGYMFHYNDNDKEVRIEYSNGLLHGVPVYEVYSYYGKKKYTETIYNSSQTIKRTYPDGHEEIINQDY